MIMKQVQKKNVYRLAGNNAGLKMAAETGINLF